MTTRARKRPSKSGSAARALASRVSVQAGKRLMPAMTIPGGSPQMAPRESVPLPAEA